MELDYRILNLYNTKQYDACLKLCAEALSNEKNHMIEFIQMRALTIQAKTAGNGYEEVNYYPQQDDLTTASIAKTPRPGTSFQRECKTAQNLQSNLRGTTALGSRSGARTAQARSVLHLVSRASRAATAVAGGSVFSPSAPLSLSLVSKDNKLFVPTAKTIFEYVYYCESDVRKAMEVAFQVQKADDTSDWWWQFSLARCYCTLGMYRNAEDCLRQALRLNKHISIYLRLVAMYVGLNQPKSALEVCKQGLAVFHGSTPLLLEQARIHEQLGNLTVAVKEYRAVAIQDPTNMEAVANIAMYNFYNDQPEIALRYYRRLLATSPSGPEIYNNLGLCCLYCNQWDLALPCFRQAIHFAAYPETRANIWFNIAHVALSTGDMALFRRSLQVCLATNSEHEAAKRALNILNSRQRVRKSNPTV